MHYNSIDLSGKAREEYSDFLADAIKKHYNDVERP